jgi:hypothetical protein
LEIAGVRADERLIQTMIQHLVAHVSHMWTTKLCQCVSAVIFIEAVP